jgi:hypothetical protein
VEEEQFHKQQNKMDDNIKRRLCVHHFFFPLLLTIFRKSLRHERELSLSQREETLNSSPLVALKEACRKQIESSEKYRVSVLRKVAAFGKL